MTRGLSQYAHEKVLATAAELFAERGIDATSVDSIAAASRVSKATIYKHWVDKEALCLEVMVHVHRLDEGPPEIDSGDLKADLIAYLTGCTAEEAESLAQAIRLAKTKIDRNQ